MSDSIRLPAAGWLQKKYTKGGCPMNHPLWTGLMKAVKAGDTSFEVPFSEDAVRLCGLLMNRDIIKGFEVLERTPAKAVRVTLKDLVVRQLQPQRAFRVKSVNSLQSGGSSTAKVFRGLARGAGSVLDLQGTPDPKLRRRISGVKRLTVQKALLKDQAALSSDLRKASRKVWNQLESKTSG